jgi:hypothetical protein
MTNTMSIRSYQTGRAPGQDREYDSLVHSSSATNDISSNYCRPSKWKLVFGCVVVATTVLLATYSVFPVIRKESKDVEQTQQLEQHQNGWHKDQKQRQHETLTVKVEGKNKRQKDSTGSCSDGHYSKRTLQFAYELPFAALFEDNKGQKTYEASSITKKDDNFYAVCDNSWAIAKITAKLTPFSTDNVQLGTPNPKDAIDDSGYESIFWDKDSFYAVRESVEHNDSDYHAVIEQVKLGLTDYTVIEKCSTEYVFEGTSKGFEGAISVRDTKDNLIVLGLCEGNYCSEKYKNDAGHGRVIAMKKRSINVKNGTNTNTSCEWETIRTINVPKSAYFRDYSDIAMDSNGRVAITTQEDSQLWVGRLLRM